jgi:hypothetical protein
MVETMSQIKQCMWAFGINAVKLANIDFGTMKWNWIGKILSFFRINENFENLKDQGITDFLFCYILFKLRWRGVGIIFGLGLRIYHFESRSLGVVSTLHLNVRTIAQWTLWQFTFCTRSHAKAHEKSWYFAFWMRAWQSPQVFGGVNGITWVAPTYFWDYFWKNFQKKSIF